MSPCAAVERVATDLLALLPTTLRATTKTLSFLFLVEIDNRYETEAVKSLIPVYLSPLNLSTSLSRLFIPNTNINCKYVDCQSVVSFRPDGVVRLKKLGWTAVRGLCLPPSQYVWTHSVAVSTILLFAMNAFGSYSYA
jgi:hypothetical protein